MASKITDAASELTLSQLHALTADLMRQRLSYALESGEGLPPAELGAIIKFLKDNGIECTREDMEEKFGDLTRLDLPSFDLVEADVG